MDSAIRSGGKRKDAGQEYQQIGMFLKIVAKYGVFLKQKWEALKPILFFSFYCNNVHDVVRKAHLLIKFTSLGGRRS